MAWMGMLVEPGRFKNELVHHGYERRAGQPIQGSSDRSMRAGTYPPPPIAIIRLGLKSCWIFSADA